jgi:hypothetical protein
LLGFAWKAALKTSNIWIKLITEYNILLFFENSIRRGFCFAGKRYAEANYASLPSYNSEEALSWILYLNSNNLYGMAMSQPLPYRNYKWLTAEELNDVAKNANEKYILWKWISSIPQNCTIFTTIYPCAPNESLSAKRVTIQN